MEHYEEIGRVWQRCGRDLPAAIHAAAGFTDNTAALDRLTENWQRLAELDIDIAAMLYQGLERVRTAMARHGEDLSPAEHDLKEIIGIVSIARVKYPDAQVNTLEELLDLGDAAIRKEIDDELDRP